MYKRLLAEAKTLNEAVNALKEIDCGESAYYLQRGFEGALHVLCSIEALTNAEKEKITHELSNEHSAKYVLKLVGTSKYYVGSYQEFEGTIFVRTTTKELASVYTMRKQAESIARRLNSIQDEPPFIPWTVEKIENCEE